MNVKVYYSAYRSADGAALYYGGGPDVGQFIRRGRIESYYTRADGSAAITMECFGVSPNGLKVELWSSCDVVPLELLLLLSAVPVPDVVSLVWPPVFGCEPWR